LSSRSPPPTIVVTGIVPGQSCDVCSPLLVTITATAPAGAGAITVAATLGRRAARASPRLSNTFFLAAGPHTLRIVAGDQYGSRVGAGRRVLGPRHDRRVDLCGAASRRGRSSSLRDLEQSLLATLYAARASRDRGDRIAEISQLRRSCTKLAAERGKKIATAFADRATGWTNDLVSGIQVEQLNARAPHRQRIARGASVFPDVP
jgi:hypothetical protein